jgi:mersacidin/lichenicidin family type 2 lantibiotic
MSRQNIIRAWKDEKYRQSLSAAERETLPPNPAGLPDLSDAQLKQAAGGKTIDPTSANCPTAVQFTCYWPLCVA